MPIIKNRNFTADDIINDYNRVKEELGKERLNRTDYLKNGQYTRQNIRTLFGEWNDFKNAIGERPLMRKKVEKEDIAKKAYELFEAHGKLTAEIFRAEAYSQIVVDKLFGGFGKMMDELGLPQEAIGKTRELSDDLFLLDLVKIQEEYGCVNNTLLLKHSSIPLASFINRYGTFGEACLKAGVYHVGQDSLRSNEGEAITAIRKVASLIDEPSFHTEITFDWMRNDRTGTPLPLDAYFPKNNLVVEYNGPRHYDPEYWTTVMSKDTDLEEIQRRDALREKLCEEKGLRFLTIPHTQKDDIESLIVDLL